MKKSVPVLTFIIAAVLVSGVAFADSLQPAVGNNGYNSYEGYLTDGTGLNRYFEPGTGYPAEAGGDYFQRYIPPEEWGKFGYGTGHMGQGYGPYIYGGRDGYHPGMFDPLPGAFNSAPPPKIKISHGAINVSLNNKIPGIKCVTVTIVAFNNVDLASQTLTSPPYVFKMPILDGVKNVRVQIYYVNNGLSATSYPL